MRVAVTGAAGFIGSHLCERLLAAGHEVLGVDSFTRFYARVRKEANLSALRAAPGFRFAEADVRNADLDGCDAVVHLAGRPGVRGGSRSLFRAANVDTTRALLEAGVPRLLLASSSSVYALASDYARSKLAAERLALRSPAEVVVLRYFTVYGPRQRPDMAFSRFVSAALGGAAAPLYGDGLQSRDFTYVTDAANATVAALERGRAGAVYDIGGGRPVSVRDALALVGRAAGTPPRVEPLPACGCEPRATLADVRRAERELGWRARVPLEDGIARQVAWAAAAGAAYTLGA